MAVKHDHMPMRGSECPEHGPIDETGAMGRHICDVLGDAVARAGAWNDQARPDFALYARPELVRRWRHHARAYGYDEGAIFARRLVADSSLSLGEAVYRKRTGRHAQVSA